MVRSALLLCAALGVALFAAGALGSRLDDDTQRLLQDSLKRGRSGRTLQAPPSFASSSAQGRESASASASAGPGFAQTSQSATGAGSQVQGISQVGQKVNECTRGPANSAACKTLTVADRVSECTDIAPDTQFNCTEQQSFGKCDADFIFMDGFCLKSCNRCGDMCTDVPPPSGGACVEADCKKKPITDGPYCLKTCGRCAATA